MHWIRVARLRPILCTLFRVTIAAVACAPR
jgi:hypothetical protein